MNEEDEEVEFKLRESLDKENEYHNEDEEDDEEIA